MGIPAISSLANMEYALYGGRSGLDMNVPSFTNGYRGNTNYSNTYGMPSYNNYGYYSAANNPTFNGNSIYGAYSQQQSNPSGQVGFGASKADLDVLGQYYVEGMSPSESLKGAAIGGVAFGLLNNMRWIIHPYNSVKSALNARNLFADIKVGTSELSKLWSNPETNRLVSSFYGNVHKLGGMSPEYSRLPLFKQQLDKGVYDGLMGEVETLLKKPNISVDEMATLNEKIKVAVDAKTGWIPQGWRWLKGKLGFNVNNTSVADKIADSGAINAAKEAALKETTGKLTLTKALKHSCSIKSGLMWMGMEFLMGLPKIITAFKHDSSTGWQQVGQTAVKGAGSAIGWAVGEGVGIWAGAWAGMKLGTAISPGIGTAIGALAGVIGGSIGMWLTGKVTKKIVGNDVADKVQAEELKKTPEGQVQLLTQTYQMAQNDKNLDARTAQAIQNVASIYGAA